MFALGCISSILFITEWMGHCHSRELVELGAHECNETLKALLTLAIYHSFLVDATTTRSAMMWILANSICADLLGRLAANVDAGVQFDARADARLRLRLIASDE